MQLVKIGCNRWLNTQQVCYIEDDPEAETVTVYFPAGTSKRLTSVAFTGDSRKGILSAMGLIAFRAYNLFGLEGR